MIYIAGCYDPRLQFAVRVWREKNGIFEGDFVPFPGPGGLKAIASPTEPGDREYAFRALAVSLREHRPGEIVFWAHEDCAAYGGAKAFSSSEAEREFQLHELDTAAALTRGRFPQGPPIRLLYFRQMPEINEFVLQDEVLWHEGR